jgi:hypothetical protein
MYESDVYDETPIELDARITLTEPLLSACYFSQGVRRLWFDESWVVADDLETIDKLLL